MFFNERFTRLHLRWVERVDFSNFGDKVRAKFDGVVIGMMRGKLVMSFLREDVCEVLTPIGYDWFDRSCCLGNLGRDGCLMDSFPI